MSMTLAERNISFDISIRMICRTRNLLAILLVEIWWRYSFFTRQAVYCHCMTHCDFWVCLQTYLPSKKLHWEAMTHPPSLWESWSQELARMVSPLRVLRRKPTVVGTSKKSKFLRSRSICFNFCSDNVKFPRPPMHSCEWVSAYLEPGLLTPRNISGCSCRCRIYRSSHLLSLWVQH